MTVRLRDTLTRSIVQVVPIEPGRVRMYSCGPTVYRYAHVGNLRTFLLADLIRRAVLFHGVDVLHVQNITDVGHMRADHHGHEVDPMLVAAGLEGRPSREIADSYEAAFHADAAMLNLLPAHEFPRATEHIDDMLALAERLEDLGHAYRSPAGNLYYDVASFPGYGALSGNTLRGPACRASRRGRGGQARPGRLRALEGRGARSRAGTCVWPSRWGEGFPGWHLECSAMALRHLGPTFDIHTGGEDNVFPHHEDEIAQSAPVVGGPPARAWVHGAHLLMSGRKMSKSAGNFQRITELADEGIDPLAFRYLCLTARYARKLNFSGFVAGGRRGGPGVVARRAFRAWRPADRRSLGCAGRPARRALIGSPRRPRDRSRPATGPTGDQGADHTERPSSRISPCRSAVPRGSPPPRGLRRRDRRRSRHARRAAHRA